MSNQSTSDFDPAGALDGSELVGITKSGLDARTTAQDIADLASGSTPVPSIEPETIHSYPVNARKWDAAIGNRSASSPARGVVLGDSLTEGATVSYLRRLRKAVARFNGNRYSPGFIPGSKGTETNIDRDYKFTVTTGTGTETTDGLALNALSLATNAIATLQTDAGANATPICDRIEIYSTLFQATGGMLEVRVDGTLVQTIDTHAPILPAGTKQSGYTYAWTGPRGPHSLTVKAINSAAVFDGAYIADGDTVYIYNGGHSALAGNAFNNVQGPWDYLEHNDFDLMLWAHGINDGLGSSTFYATNITNAIGKARTAQPDISLGVMTPYAVLNRTTWNTVYVPAAKVAAATDEVPVCDVSWMLDQPADVADPYGLISDSDDLHPTAAGADLIGAAMSRFTLGFDGDFTTQEPRDTSRYALFSRNSTQNATTAVATALTPNTTDRAGDVDWTTFAVNTPHVPGWWKVKAKIEVAANATGYRELQAHFNSTTVHILERRPALASGTTLVNGEQDILFNGVDDFVIIRVLQDSGSTLAVQLLQLSFRWMGPDD